MCRRRSLGAVLLEREGLLGALGDRMVDAGSGRGSSCSLPGKPGRKDSLVCAIENLNESTLILFGAWIP